MRIFRMRDGRRALSPFAGFCLSFLACLVFWLVFWWFALGPVV